MTQFITLTVDKYCESLEKESVKESAKELAQGSPPQDGRLLVFATDTIWGIGCLANDGAAVEQIYQLKIRPRNKPLMALLPDKESIKNIITPTANQSYVKEIIDRFLLLDKNFIGKLALVCPYHQDKARWKIANPPPHDDSICFRLPQHKTAKKILAAVAQYKKTALLVTSLNLAGNPPVTNRAMAISFLQNLPRHQQEKITLILATDDGVSDDDGIYARDDMGDNATGNASAGDDAKGDGGDRVGVGDNAKGDGGDRVGVGDNTKGDSLSPQQPSTILSILTNPPRILRHGALAQIDVEKILSVKIET